MFKKKQELPLDSYVNVIDVAKRRGTDTYLRRLVQAVTMLKGMNKAKV